jgi:hypothetical protein
MFTGNHMAATTVEAAVGVLLNNPINSPLNYDLNR